MQRKSRHTWKKTLPLKLSLPVESVFGRCSTIQEKKTVFGIKQWVVRAKFGKTMKPRNEQVGSITRPHDIFQEIGKI